MYCTNCGANLKYGTKFCTNCGANQTLDENAKNESITPQQEEENKELKKTVRKRKSLKSEALISCIAVVTVLIIALVGIFSIKLVKVEKIQDSIDLGNKYLNDGNYEEAILVFEKAIKIDKKNINARVSLIKTYLLIRNSDKAKSIANESIKIDIKNEEVYIVMADMYCEINMDDEALLILKEGYENTESKKIQNKIKEIESKLPVTNIDITVDENDEYKLPSKVKIKINNTEKELIVNWEENNVDTTKIGTYTFNGVTEEYDRKVKLTLTINADEREVQMDKNMKDNLDDFFSNFAETHVESFKRNNISDEALILFGINYIFWNSYHGMGNEELFETIDSDPNNGYIKDSYIEDKAYYYFGKKPTTHKSIPDHLYENGYYKFGFASGPMPDFAQIDKLYDLGNNLYRAEVSIYNTYLDFSGDPHGNPNDWVASAPLYKEFIAEIKKVNENGEERYILISYKEQ